MPDAASFLAYRLSAIASEEKLLRISCWAYGDCPPLGAVQKAVGAELSRKCPHPVRSEVDLDLLRSCYAQTYVQRRFRELARVGGELALPCFLRAGLLWTDGAPKKATQGFPLRLNPELFIVSGCFEGFEENHIISPGGYLSANRPSAVAAPEYCKFPGHLNLLYVPLKNCSIVDRIEKVSCH